MAQVQAMVARASWCCSALSRLAAVVAAMAVIALPAASLLAQAEPARETLVDADGYSMLKPNEVLAKDKAMQIRFRTNLVRVWREGFTSDMSQDVFIRYFREFLFPMMTQTTEADLKKLAEDRTALLRDLENCRSAEVHAVLRNLALREMTYVVRNNFHPGVRYNAMLIISSLNDQEAVRVGASPTLPEPMIAALPVILAEFVRPENSDAIRVAALLGLSRHLEWENYKRQDRPAMTPDNRARAVAELLAFLEMRDPPAGRSYDGHQWMRRRAAEALAFAAMTRPEPTIAAALEKVLRDDNEPLALRCTVASCIGKLQLQGPARLDPAATAKELGYLAMVVCDRELTRLDTMKKIEQDRKAKMGAMGGGYGGYEDMGGYGGMPGGYEDPGGYGGMPGGYEMPGGYGGPGAAGGATGPRPARPGTGPGGASGSAGSGYPGYPGMGGLMPQDPKAYRFEYARRRIRHQLHTVHLGLTGGDDIVAPRSGAAQQQQTQTFQSGMITVATAPADKQVVERIYASLKKMIEAVERADPAAADLARLDRDLKREIRTMESLTRKLAAPVVPAVTPEDLPEAGPGDIPDDAPAPPPAATPAAAAAASR